MYPQVCPEELEIEWMNVYGNQISECVTRAEENFKESMLTIVCSVFQSKCSWNRGAVTVAGRCDCGKVTAVTPSWVGGGRSKDRWLGQPCGITVSAAIGHEHL